MFNFKIGKRKPWYIFGTALCVVVFICSFQGNLLGMAIGNDNETNRFIYYTVLLSLYNVILVLILIFI